MMVTMTGDDLDLVGVVDIARRLHVPRTTVSMWNTRRATTRFPAPLGEPAMGPVFDWESVKAWHDDWTGSEATS